MVDRGLAVFTHVGGGGGGSRVRVTSSIGNMLMMTTHLVNMRFTGRTDRSRKHPVVIRAAVEHGRCRESLQGKREQQKPHQCSAKSTTHLRSVERMLVGILRGTRPAPAQGRIDEGLATAKPLTLVQSGGP